jgi:hypothetical protein
MASIPSGSALEKKARKTFWIFRSPIHWIKIINLRGIFWAFRVSFRGSPHHWRLPLSTFSTTCDWFQLFRLGIRRREPKIAPEICQMEFGGATVCSQPFLSLWSSVDWDSQRTPFSSWTGSIWHPR